MEDDCRGEGGKGGLGRERFLKFPEDHAKECDLNWEGKEGMLMIWETGINTYDKTG